MLIQPSLIIRLVCFTWFYHDYLWIKMPTSAPWSRDHDSSRECHVICYESRCWPKHLDQSDPMAPYARHVIFAWIKDACVSILIMRSHERHVGIFHAHEWRRWHQHLNIRAWRCHVVYAESNLSISAYINAHAQSQSTSHEEMCWLCMTQDSDLVTCHTRDVTSVTCLSHVYQDDTFWVTGSNIGWPR